LKKVDYGDINCFSIYLSVFLCHKT